jgi:hypothetical protein
VRLEALGARPCSQTDSITVRTLSALDEIRDLEPAHRQLFAAADAPHVGATFPCLIAEAATAPPDPPWQVFTAWRQQELAGCLQGRRVDRLFKGVRVPTFQTGTRLVADPLVASSGDITLQRLLDELIAVRGDCATYVFPRLSERAYLQVTRAAAALGLPWQWRWSTYAYAFDTTVGLDEFLDGMDGDRRRELRRRGRRLAREHESEYLREQQLGPDGDAVRLDSFASLEDSGWKGREASSILRKPGYRQYFGELVRSASRAGMLAWHTLRADGRAIAIYMTLRTGKTLWLPKIAYDERCAMHAPGMLLTHQLLTDAIADPEIDEVDNISAAPWVRTWAPAPIPFRSVTIFGPNPRGQLLYRAQAARGALRRLARRLPVTRGPVDRPFI